MTGKLVIKAGKTAYAHICKNGLEPKDICVVLGASGAAKWLSIYGLDRVIFSTWLKEIQHKIHLFGTSIGAWKLAAAAQKDPASAFDSLKDAYIAQTYKEGVTPEKINDESFKIFDKYLPCEKIDEILSNSYMAFGFSAVRCKRAMASENKLVLGSAMIGAFMANLFSRRSQSYFFDRTVFHTPGNGQSPLDLNGFNMSRVALNTENFRQALMASGSIPIIMDGVWNIPGAVEGIYRDGGILDYHPAFSLSDNQNGFILYPHFYPHIIPGWFDKNFSNRRASGDLLDRTILLAPSKEHIATLPFSRIPDRKDFSRFNGKDEQRYEVWHKAALKSHSLGQEFLGAAVSGRIKDLVTTF